MATPRTLPEWLGYVAALPAASLANKARAVNHIDVVEQLLEEGLTAAEVETLYIALARRLARENVRVAGALYDWAELAGRTPPLDVAAADGDWSDE